MHRLLKYIILCFVLSLFSPPFSWSANFYVAQTATGDGSGDDDSNRASVATHNAGTGNFANLDGDTVFIKGTITSNLNVPDSGSSTAYITYDGYEAGACSPVSGSECISSAIFDDAEFRTNGEDYIIISDLRFKNRSSTNEGIAISSSSYIIVKDNYFYHNYRGILVGASQNVTIGGANGDGNYFEENGQDTGSSDINIYTSSHDVTVSYNHHNGGNHNEWGTDGVMIENSYDILIEMNTIHGYQDHTGNAGEDGIDVKYGGSYNVIVRYNHIYDCYQTGVTVQSAHDVFIHGNYIHENGPTSDTKNLGQGISLFQHAGEAIPYNIKIIRNVLYLNQEAGVSIRDGVYNVDIQGNTIIDNGTAAGDEGDNGFRNWDAGSGIVVENNVFWDNEADGFDRDQLFVNSGETSSTTLHDNRFWHATDGNATTIDWGNVDGVDPTTIGSDNVRDASPSLTSKTDPTPTAEDQGKTLNNQLYSVAITDGWGNTQDNEAYQHTALYSDNTDWSTIPPTVAIVFDTDYNRGAYASTDDDIVVTVTVSDAAGAEEGQDQFTYTVACSPDCNATAISLLFPGAGQAAQIDEDFNCDHESNITITGSSDTVTCTPVDDALAEGDEYAHLSIDSGSGYIVGSPYLATGTITDNDSSGGSDANLNTSIGGSFH